MKNKPSVFLSHIYIVSTDGKLNSQFTFGDKSCTNPRFSPDGQYLSFTSGRGKDGKNQLYLLRLSGGEAWPITTQKGNVSSYRWSPDSRQIAFAMTELLTATEEKDRKERKDWEVVDVMKNAHLYTVGLTKELTGQYPVKRLTRGSFHVTTFDFSPDGRTLAFAHQPSSWVDQFQDADISTVPADSGAVRSLVTGKGGDETPTFSPDGQSIAFVSAMGEMSWMGKQAVCVIPANGGAVRRLALTPDENPGLMGWTADSRSVVVQEPMRTQTGLYRLPITGGALTKLPVPEKGIALGYVLNPKGDLTFLHQAPESPSDVYAATLTEPLGRKLTDIHAEYVSGKTPTRTEVVSWKAKDGKFTIEGLLTYPSNYQPGRKYPLFLNVHGGPTGVFVQNYTGAGGPYPVQAFAQQGYAMLRVNPRGSTGYGADFRWANYRDWGNNDYDDLMAGVDKVIDMGLAHPDSLVESGWSYGGYMTTFFVLS